MRLRRVNGEGDLKVKAAKFFGTFALSLVFLLMGCTATEDDDTTNTFLTIVAMTTTNGGTGEEGEDLFSDVCQGGGAFPNCTVFNDNATVTIRAQVKDSTHPASINGVNDIVITRYRVTYLRADGRNTPGVDVPFPFDGVTSFRIPPDGSLVDELFMVVRQQAKLESPLRELAGAGGNVLISTLTQIDFFGRDGAGRDITVRGHVNIVFGDF